jgi:hypothetical protein
MSYVSSQAWLGNLEFGGSIQSPGQLKIRMPFSTSEILNSLQVGE